MTVRRKGFENIVGKGENAGNQHFLLFPQCFLPFLTQSSTFESHLICRLQMLSIWTGLKLSFGKGLTLYQTGNIKEFEIESSCRQYIKDGKYNSIQIRKKIKTINGKGENAR